jgi:hypothetical protein
MIAAIYNESLQVFCGLLFAAIAMLIWAALCFFQLK